MRITYKQDGGFAYFPGLNAPFTLDTSHMAAADVTQLEQLIAACAFFDLPSTTPRARGADKLRYTITVEDGKRKHTVHLIDPIGNTDLQALVEFIQAARLGGTSPP